MFSQDNSDGQYRNVRNNIPALTGLVAAFLGIKTLYTQFLKARQTTLGDNLHLIPFLLTFSVVMVVVLHGTSILKIFAILSINYLIAKFFRGSRLSPLLTWIFNTAVLFANELYAGYRFAALHSSLKYLVS